MKESHLHEEEHFHARDRKWSKKEKKYAQDSDRSKFKKSDQDQLKKEPFLEDPLLKKGRVVSISGEGIWIDSEGKVFLCSLKGQMKKEKKMSKNLIAVGDLVRILPINDTEGTIVHIEDRYSKLSRLDMTGKKEQLIAVNIDQVLIVGSLFEPPLKPALIDRYLIAAELGNIHPVIVINKIDLLDQTTPEEQKYFQDFLSAYEALGYPIISVSAMTKVGLDNLKSIMKNKVSVFAGQSGSGKSSLLNAAFDWDRKTGSLTLKTSKGSHTTSVAEYLALPDGGYCIDTPGIRSFGIWNIRQEDVTNHFREFLPLAENCRYPNCHHLTEPNCEVKKAMQEGRISYLRYESYSHLMEEIIAGIDNRTKRKL